MGKHISKSELIRAAAAHEARVVPPLHELARYVAQRVENDVRAVFSFHDRRMFHPWRLLAFVIFARCLSVKAPEAAAAFAFRDAGARKILLDDFPSAELLMRFEEYNREMIAACHTELVLLAASLAQRTASCKRRTA